MVRDKQFEQATKDFINLMGLDWDGGFRCPHGLQGGVILDGITLGFKLSNACFVKPWQCGVNVSMGAYLHASQPFSRLVG